MGAENFEDYDYIRSSDAHFSYKEIALEDGDGRITPSTKHAHSGNTSLQVPFDTGAGIPIELLGFLPPDPDSDGDGIPDDEDYCPETPSINVDFDDDGLGDECDDNAVPIITILDESGQFKWWRKQKLFQIDGTPNTTVRCKILNIQNGAHGWKARINDNPLIYNYSVTQEYDIPLDATGRATVKMQMGVNAPSKRRHRAQHNHTIIELAVCHPATGIPLDESISPTRVRIHVVGFKKPNSGNNGSGPKFPPLF